MRISDWSADVCSSDLQYLAPQQIQCLNAVAALVDRVQSIVSIELLDRVLAGVAIAAEYLNRQIVGRNAPLCRPRFDDRGEQLQQRASTRALGIIREIGRAHV